MFKLLLITNSNTWIPGHYHLVYENTLWFGVICRDCFIYIILYKFFLNYFLFFNYFFIKQTFLYEAQVNGIPQTSNYWEMRSQRCRNWSNYDYDYHGRIISLNEQHDIFVFQPIYFRFGTQEGNISVPSLFYKIAAIFIHAEVAVISKPTLRE